MTERSGKGSVPRYQNIELKPSGKLEFLRGRVQSGNPVSSLAMTLNALLPRNPPTQLRLLVSTAGPGSATYKSVGEFIEALKFFERPGRRATLAEIHKRALETPVTATPVGHASSEATPSDTRKKRRFSPRQRWAMAAVAVFAVGAGAMSLGESHGGMVSDRVSSLRAVVGGWWAQAMDATSEIRASASEDFSMVMDRMGEVRDGLSDDLGLGDVDAETVDEDTAAADPEAGVRGRGASRPSAVSAPEPSASEATSDGDSAEASVPDAVVADGASIPVEPVETEAHETDQPLPSSMLFDSTDLQVTPPTTVKVQLPTLAVDEPWDEQVGVVEAIISEAGEVEKVKLITPPRSVHQAMMLSAVKTWRFRPALRDGDAVRYRHLIPMAIPR